MSVILRNNSNSSSGGIGGSGDGFPPGDVDIIANSSSDSEVWVKWSDPENTIINGSTISTWAGTILVRNTSHYPINETDGVLVIDNKEKDKYKDNWYVDAGLTNGVTYYYRFFTYNPEGVYNNSGNLIFKQTPVLIHDVFGNNSWTGINAAIQSGSIPSSWNIGDTIMLHVKDVKVDSAGQEGDMDIEMQIWDFDHFDKSDGSGKAKICLGCKGDTATPWDRLNSLRNTGGWAEFSTRISDQWAIKSVYNGLPDELKAVAKEVTIPYNVGYSTEIKTCNDVIFIPSHTELNLSIGGYPSIGTKLSIFTDNNSRKKSFGNTDEYTDWSYWTRTSAINNDDNSIYCDGRTGLYGETYTSWSRYICFMFNI